MARWSFALFASLQFALCNCQLGHALDELPAKIPSRPAVTSELIEQATRAVSQVTDFDERFDLLQAVLHDIYLIPADQRQKLTDLFERDVQQVVSELRLISARTSVNIASPQLAARLARQVKDERLHDAWLTDLVRYYVPRDKDLTRQLLTEIKNPFARAQAMIWVAADERLEFEEARSILLGAKQLGLTEPVSPHLLRFADQHLDEVLGMIRAELQIEDAVSLLAREAAARRYKGTEPELAQRLMAAAVELIPTSMAPATATRTVLMNGYADLDRQNAFELYEKYLLEWVPKLRVDEFTALHLVLTRTDLWQGLEDLEQLATNDVGRSRPILMASVVRRAAMLHGPRDALDWLDSAAGPIRNAAVEPIVLGLHAYASNHQIVAKEIQEWVEALAGFALRIANPDQQWRAIEAIRRLAEDQSAVLPNAVEMRRTELRKKNKKLKVEESYDSIAKLAVERQRQEIDARWRSSVEAWEVNPKLRTIAALVRDSSLSVDEKRDWFEKLPAEARARPDLKERAALLSGIGVAVGKIDPERSLQIHWEELALAKQLGLKPTLHDWGDALGTMFPLASVDEVFDHTFHSHVGNVNELVQLLWTFARKLQSEDDRNATLEAIGKILIRHKDFDRAAGVASLLSAPQRQARLSAKIIAAQSRKATNN